MYMHDWTETQLAGLESDFNLQGTELDGAEILLASYTYEDYSGSAYVLFRKDGKLWEVYGSHCSCYGLEEDQWEPEETNLENLERLVDKAHWTVSDCHAELVEIVRKLRAES